MNYAIGYCLFWLAVILLGFALLGGAVKVVCAALRKGPEIF